jgi:hypothetical protein
MEIFALILGTSVVVGVINLTVQILYALFKA